MRTPFGRLMKAVLCLRLSLFLLTSGVAVIHTMAVVVVWVWAGVHDITDDDQHEFYLARVLNLEREKRLIQVC